MNVGNNENITAVLSECAEWMNDLVKCLCTARSNIYSASKASTSSSRITNNSTLRKIPQPPSWTRIPRQKVPQISTGSSYARRWPASDRTDPGSGCCREGKQSHKGWERGHRQHCRRKRWRGPYSWKAGHQFGCLEGVSAIFKVEGYCSLLTIVLDGTGNGNSDGGVRQALGAHVEVVLRDTSGSGDKGVTTLEVSLAGEVAGGNGTTEASSSRANLGDSHGNGITNERNGNEGALNLLAQQVNSSGTTDSLERDGRDHLDWKSLRFPFGDSLRIFVVMRRRRMRQRRRKMGVLYPFEDIERN
jgi:hypothetical protein